MIRLKIHINNNEVWKDIVGYEGIYQVSNHGRVKALPKTIEYSDGKVIPYDEIIMRSIIEKEGYKVVNLTNNGVQRQFRVHRLVAKAFIPNPNNYPQVNHRDEIKSNNNVENLEWCTHKYNQNYGTSIERSSKNRSRSVMKMTLDGEDLKEYASATVATQDGFDNSAIGKCCKGYVNTHRGYKWRYVDGS